jgi:hypothetical protein
MAIPTPTIAAINNSLGTAEDTHLSSANGIDSLDITEIPNDDEPRVNKLSLKMILEDFADILANPFFSKMFQTPIFNSMIAKQSALDSFQISAVINEIRQNIQPFLDETELFVNIRTLIDELLTAITENNQESINRLKKEVRIVISSSNYFLQVFEYFADYIAEYKERVDSSVIKNDLIHTLEFLVFIVSKMNEIAKEINELSCTAISQFQTYSSKDILNGPIHRNLNEGITLETDYTSINFNLCLRVSNWAGASILISANYLDMHPKSLSLSLNGDPVRATIYAANKVYNVHFTYSANDLNNPQNGGRIEAILLEDTKPSSES